MSLVDQKFENFLSTLPEESAAAVRKIADSLPEDQRREWIIEFLPVAREAAVHESHCNQGEYEGTCKYGDQDCPALPAKKNPCSNCDFDMGENYEHCGAAEDGVCPECGTDSKASTYEVKVCRTSYGFQSFKVQARSAEEAEEKAMDEAGDYLYNERSSEYSVEGIQRL